MPQKRWGTAPTAPNPEKWIYRALFAFGTVFLIGLIVIALVDRDPTQSSWYIYLCALAIAGGGITALLPGSISLELKSGIKAGGALAVFGLIFYFGKDLRNQSSPAQDLHSFLRPSPNPASTDVYVVLNYKVVKADLVSDKSELKVENTREGKDIAIVRGPGGIRIDFKALTVGDKMFVAAYDRDQSWWWKTQEMTIPEAELELENASLATISRRVGIH